MNHNNGKKNGGNQQRAQKPKNEVRKGSPFINPYTFVPISTKEPERRKVEKEEKRLSGKIVCDLSVGSSLFIPNTSKKFRYSTKEKNHFFSEFFSYEDLSEWKDDIPNMPPAYPRIPGSELRGMVRNVYEQLTNSCFSVIDDENVPKMRTSDPKDAGLIDMETKLLYVGERLMLNTGKKPNHVGKVVKLKNYRTGDKVFVKPSKDFYEKTIITENKKIKTFRYVEDIMLAKAATCPLNWEEGIVLIGEDFPKKHHDSVIIKRTNKPAELDSNALNRLEMVIADYEKYQSKRVVERQTAHKVYGRLYRKLKEKKKGILPVFYTEVDGIYYLSPSIITREVFGNTIYELLKQNRNHQCCDGENDTWCPACRLFGMVGGSEKSVNAIASRLRFSDSEVFQNPDFMTTRILPILGSPKYSSVEFYLEKPLNGVMWNYDYVKDKNKKKKIYSPELKGRKVYWLGKDEGKTAASTKDEANQEHLNQRSAIRALKKGSTEFSVYFEDISEEELKCLLFSLDFNQHEETFHRIGKGKPFGMGAIKVKVKSLIFRDYSFQEGKIVAEDTPGDVLRYRLQDDDFSGKYQKEKEEILIYSTKLEKKERDKVAYPTVEGSETIYEWFVQNRGSVKDEMIVSFLPRIDKDKTLYKYFVKGK